VSHAPHLRAAVIGAGPIGAVHGRALSEAPGVTLVGVCARTTASADRLAARFGVPGYDRISRMLSQTKPEIVCVATGNQDHQEPTLKALRAGAHVFCEKPLAFDLDQAHRMVATADDVGRSLAVNFNHRFSEPYRRALEFMAEHQLGAHAYTDVKFAGSLYKELNHRDCMMIETQGHSLDLLRLFGGEVGAVSAFMHDPRGIGVRTSAALTLAFVSGAVGSLVGSWDSSYDHPHAQVLEHCCTDGHVVVDNIIDSVRLYRHGGQQAEEWRPGLFEGRERDFTRTIDAHIHAFAEAVAEGRKPPVTGHDGLRALELTFAAIRSHDERRTMEV
jgi:predicted dehydrogenase